MFKAACPLPVAFDGDEGHRLPVRYASETARQAIRVSVPHYPPRPLNDEPLSADRDFHRRHPTHATNSIRAGPAKKLPNPSVGHIF